MSGERETERGPLTGALIVCIDADLDLLAHLASPGRRRTPTTADLAAGLSARITHNLTALTAMASGEIPASDQPDDIPRRNA